MARRRRPESHSGMEQDAGTLAFFRSRPLGGRSPMRASRAHAEAGGFPMRAKVSGAAMAFWPRS
ncbi:hypothetical protein A0U92_15100 [Acetobacter aceti]|uniref:Uncharacterized protein n=2 Tax=Acetobacter aceti TaxID=435 RepID=A0A1U9KJ93_ACEAC|nr:hypothetical protein A0U92_15100 [Acetobacter aceti]